MRVHPPCLPTLLFPRCLCLVPGVGGDLESPAGVGCSVCTAQAEQKNSNFRYQRHSPELSSLAGSRTLLSACRAAGDTVLVALEPSVTGIRLGVIGISLCPAPMAAAPRAGWALALLRAQPGKNSTQGIPECSHNPGGECPGKGSMFNEKYV